MRLFVTGGSGFLGSALLRRLKTTNHQVFALARSNNSAELISSLGATPVVGCLTNINYWEEALTGIDIVIHCAAPVIFWGPWDRYEREIVQATQELAKASERKQVKRFVYISSESVLQDKQSLLDINEAHPYPDCPNSYYGRAKMLAEKELLALNLDSIILRPSFIWGPDGANADTIAKKALDGEFMWVDQGRAEFEAVHVDNVVEAILCSLSNGRAGEIYFITDQEKATVRQFWSKYFQTLQIPIPQKSISGWLAILIASSLETLWKALRIKSSPPLSKFDLSFVAIPRRYSTEKATNELRYTPVITRAQGLNAMKPV